MKSLNIPNILIPCAGNGQRFKDAGYELPKPLIDIHGKSMIERVINNIGKINANWIFIIHNNNILKDKLKSIIPDCIIIEIEKTTEGACCTTLLAKEFINNNTPLVIANCDQLVTWDNEEFFQNLLNGETQIAVFKSSFENKWSYAKIENNIIIAVAEKNPISEWATCGIYGWSKGSDYIYCAEQMISKNIRTNNEFYVCPIFNEFNGTIKPFYVEAMYGLGTPEDLKQYESSYLHIW